MIGSTGRKPFPTETGTLALAGVCLPPVSVLRRWQGVFHVPGGNMTNDELLELFHAWTREGERIQAGEIDEATLKIERDGQMHSGKVIRSESGEFVFSFQRTDEKRN